MTNIASSLAEIMEMDEQELLDRLPSLTAVNGVEQRELATVLTARFGIRPAYDVGTTWVFFVPPGWLVGGTVIAHDDGDLVLAGVVYFEGAVQGYSVIGDVGKGTTPDQQRQACGSHWGLPDTTRIRRDAILMGVPCKYNLLALSRDQAAREVEGA